MPNETQALVDHNIKVFAKLNGWSRTDRHFSFHQLAGTARGRRDNDQAPLWWRGDQIVVGNVMDHMFWFRHQRRPIAIMSMPYDAKLVDAETLARFYGLDVFTPPIKKSGCWYPNWTDCYVFMRSGSSPRWLPQQCDQIVFQQYVELYRLAQAKDRQKYEADQRRRAKRDLPPAYNDQVREYMPPQSDEEYARDEEDKQRKRDAAEGFDD